MVLGCFNVPFFGIENFPFVLRGVFRVVESLAVEGESDSSEGQSEEMSE